MPYINQSERDFLAEGNVPQTAGQVNYLVTKLMNACLENYDDANDIATGICYVIHCLVRDGVWTADTRSDGSLSSFERDLEKIVNTANVSVEEIVGALQNAHLEFYIRKVRPYEDTKIEQNGDV